MPTLTTPPLASSQQRLVGNRVEGLKTKVNDASVADFLIMLTYNHD
jgi:hypothetical protein